MVQSNVQAPFEPLYWFSNSRDQCRPLAFYREVVMAKQLPGKLIETTTQDDSIMIEEPWRYQLKVAELKVQEKRLQTYLKTLSNMLLARHQLGKVAMRRIS